MGLRIHLDALENKSSVQIFAVLGCYAAQIGNILAPFRDNLSVPFSSAGKSKKNDPETSVNTNLRLITSQKSEDLIYTTAEA